MYNYIYIYNMYLYSVLKTSYIVNSYSYVLMVIILLITTEQLPRKFTLRQRLGPGITNTRKKERKTDLIKKPHLKTYKLKIRQHQKKKLLTPYKKKSLNLKGDTLKLKSRTYKKLLETLQPQNKEVKEQFKRVKPLGKLHTG